MKNIRIYYLKNNLKSHSSAEKLLHKVVQTVTGGELGTVKKQEHEFTKGREVLTFSNGSMVSLEAIDGVKRPELSKADIVYIDKNILAFEGVDKFINKIVNSGIKNKYSLSDREANNIRVFSIPDGETDLKFEQINKPL